MFKPLRGTFLNRTHPLARVLLACWLFNEGTGDKLFDLTGNGNEGTLTSMDPATDWVGTDKGWALDFDGSDDYISISNSSTLENMTAMAMEVIFRVASVAGGNDWNTIIMKGYFGNNGYGFLMQDTVFTSSGTLNMYIPGIGTLGTTLSLSTDTWYHLIGTANSNERKIYLDGLEIASGSGGTVSAGTEIISIGKSTISSQYAMDGDFAKVAIYGRALSTAEALRLFLNPYAMFLRPSVASRFGTLAAPPPPSFDALLLAGD